MGKIISSCPSCQGGALTISKIECTQCHTTFEGKFDVPLLDRLAEDELSFVVDFVKCSGSLKEMASKLEVSYPTLRNKLNDLIDKIEKLERAKKKSQTEILDLLEKGKISVKDAIAKLRK